MYYKLNKRKSCRVEGLHNKICEEILAYFALLVFWNVAIAAVVINFNCLFSDIGVTVFIAVFTALLFLISALFFVKYFPVYKKRYKARKILKNCMLTDGTVTAVNKQKIWHSVNSRSYSYYRVLLEYSFSDFGGALRLGKHTGNYSEIPFYAGQNLMIAFNDSDSIILNKFTLSEGAEEFAKAEEERERVDFSALTGDLIKVNTLKPVYLADYSWSLFYKTRKRRKRLKQILEDNPRFTEGRFFIKKSTYQSKNANNKFYCFIEESGKKRIEECDGIDGFNDGDKVTVAYGGGFSEIITGYALKKPFIKTKRKN